jgi:hypothetical protein
MQAALTENVYDIPDPLRLTVRIHGSVTASKAPKLENDHISRGNGTLQGGYMRRMSVSSKLRDSFCSFLTAVTILAALLVTLRAAAGPSWFAPRCLWLPASKTRRNLVPGRVCS